MVLSKHTVFLALETQWTVKLCGFQGRGLSSLLVSGLTQKGAITAVPQKDPFWCFFLMDPSHMGRGWGNLLVYPVTTDHNTSQTCCAMNEEKGCTPTFRRIFRFLSDDKWMQRSITSLAIWMCTGSGGSTSGRVSFSSTLGGDDCSSERTELVTML